MAGLTIDRVLDGEGFPHCKAPSSYLQRKVGRYE